MNSDKLNATIILSIQNVELYQTQSKKTSLMTKGTLNVLFLPSHNCFLLQVNNFNYHLSKELPFVAHLDPNPSAYSSYFFPNVEGYYIIKIIDVKTPESISSFETILSNHCTLTYHQEQIENAFEEKKEEEKGNKTKTEIATDIIYKGGEITKAGLIKGAEVISLGITKLGGFIQEKYIKPSTDKDLGESTVNKVEIANVTTGAVVTLTKAQVIIIILALSLNINNRLKEL